MFGVQFTATRILRRMVIFEDFEYYPLRKEFPPLGLPGSIELNSTTPDSEGEYNNKSSAYESTRVIITFTVPLISGNIRMLS